MTKNKSTRLQNLRVLLYANDITQEFLAERWGVSPCYISRRVTGGLEFSSAEKEDLCKLLGIRTYRDYIKNFHPVMLEKLEG